MAKRTIESIKKENERYKTLADDLLSMEQHGKFDQIDESLKKSLKALRVRAEHIHNIVERTRDQVNPLGLEYRYEQLEKCDGVFAKLSREQRKEWVKRFEAVNQEELLNDPRWHAAYSAFMSTECIGISREAQVMGEQRQAVKAAREKVVRIKQEYDNAVAEAKKKDSGLNPKKLTQEHDRINKEYWSLVDKYDKIYWPKEEALRKERILKEKLSESEKVTGEFDRDIEEYSKRKEIFTDIIEYLEKNKEELKTEMTALNEANEDRDQKKKESDDAKKVAKESVKDCEECIAELKQLGEGENVSPQLKARVDQIKKNLELDDLQIQLMHLQIGDEKYASAEKINTICGNTKFFNKLKKMAKDYSKDINELKNLTIEQFDDLLTELENENNLAGNRDALDAALTTEERNKVQVASSKYVEAYNKAWEDVMGFINKRNEHQKSRAVARVKEKSYTTKVFDAFSKLSKNRYTEDVKWRVGTYFSVENLEKYKKELKKADDALQDCNKRKQERVEKFTNAKKEYDDFIKSEEYGVVIQYNDLKEQAEKLNDQRYKYQSKINELSHIKELGQKYKEAVAEEKQLPKPDDNKLTDSIKNGAKALSEQRGMRKGNHKDTSEFENMIKAVNQVANWTPDSGISRKEALANMEKQASAYLKAKNAQWFHFVPTPLRRHRMEYAKAIMQYAKDNIVSLEEAGIENDVEIKQELKNDTIENNAKEMEEMEDFIAL